tara:strand:+ start:1328 stop:1549 length:222 start_codon:yes stop_codon:yes gene_type:complete
MTDRFRSLRVKNRNLQEETTSYSIDEVEEITDEIEKALVELKENLDLPTEEVEKSIQSRRKFKFANLFDKASK